VKMPETTVEADNFGPLPNEARMSAYYYSFEPTGIGPVDAILSAIAVAGKAAHHTEAWNDHESTYFTNRPGLVDGTSAVDLIQQNADAAAEAIRTLLAAHPPAGAR